MPNPVLTRLLEQRDEQTTFIDNLLSQVETDKRDLVDAERRNLEAAQERIKQIDDQVKPLEEFEATRSAHSQSANRPAPTNRADSGDDGEHRGGGERRNLSVQDRASAPFRTSGEFVATQLRAAGNPQAGVEPDADAARRMAEYRIAHQTTADTPGLLPVEIVGPIHSDLDAARPFVNSIGARDGGQSKGKKFLRPYVTQHTQVGKQTAEKSELPSRPLKIDTLEFNKETYGGALNVSRQDIDWTSPSAWDAIISDLQDQYGIFTEDGAAAEFDSLVTEKVELIDTTFEGYVDAIYDAAAHAMTAGGTKRASALRMPNHIWTSVDMWGELGKIMAKLKADSPGSGIGSSSAANFSGTMLDFTRTMVPGLPPKTMIVGRTNLAEFYEQRIGLLQAVEPSVLGIQIAYGGYGAFGLLDATGFVKIVNEVA